MAGNEPSTKRCTKCSEWKPTSEFGKQKSRKDGLNPWCRTCRKAAAAEYHARPEIKAKRKAHASAIYQANRQEILARNKAWDQRNPGHAAKRHARWRSRNPDKMRDIYARYDARRVDRRREWLRMQRAKKPEQYIGYVAARRARRYAAGGQYTAADIRRIYEAQNGRCAYCRVKLGRAYHRDHIIALKNGGSNAASNIQLLCRPCNLKKKDKDPLVFARQLGRLL